MGEEKEDKGFTIKDKRVFSEKSDEEGRPGEAAVETPADSSTEAQSPKSDDSAEPADSGAYSQLPKINFATFIFSLNSSALVHLGVIEDPATGTKAKQLPLAKQTIDILGVLEEKTKGNLTEDEGHLLKNILHDLRLMYVKEVS